MGAHPQRTWRKTSGECCPGQEICIAEEIAGCRHFHNDFICCCSSVTLFPGDVQVRIKAVPEGTVVPVKNVLVTVENTDPACFWLVNYLETFLVQATHFF